MKLCPKQEGLAKQQIPQNQAKLQARSQVFWPFLSVTPSR